jgi:16S rRNA (guanine527-N7)-methyltransferase
MSLSPSGLRNIFSERGFALEEDQAEKFYLYLQEILKWNKVHNLVGEDDPRLIVERHFIDSLTLALCFEDLGVPWRGRSLADVGSGAGFPGVPLKIYLGDLTLTLVESSSKKCSFLEYLKVRIREDYEVVCERAQRLGRRFYIVVARALGTFEEIAPVLEGLSEGYVFVMKGSRIKENWVKEMGYTPYRARLEGFRSYILWKRVAPQSS